MTAYEHLNLQLEIAKQHDDDFMRCDVEEVADVLSELTELRDKETLSGKIIDLDRIMIATMILDLCAGCVIVYGLIKLFL